MNDVSFILVDIRFGMEAPYEVIGFIAQVLKRLRAHPGHDIHVQHNIDRIG